MIRGFDIIIGAFANWHAKWGTPQQMAVRLAPDNRVLYLDEPRSFLRSLKGHRENGAMAWTGARMQEVRPNLFVYHMPNVFLPLGGLPLSVAKTNMAIDGRLMAACVSRAAAALGFRDPIVWNLSPLHGSAAPLLRGRLWIQEETDIWANYLTASAGRQLVEWMERRLLARADLVFMGTEQARERREQQGISRTMHVVSPGVDAAHFATARLPETAVPADVAGLPHPIVGTIGVMDPARFDVSLVRHIAVSRPDGSVVLIGPTRPGLDLGPLRGLTNVHILGNRPIAELPGYLKAMDVCIVPDYVTEITRYTFPTKMLEYLASGKPVVVPPMPALLAFRDVVRVAESHEQFVAAAAELLATDTSASDARQAVAREHTWEHRIEAKSAHIIQALETATSARGASQ